VKLDVRCLVTGGGGFIGRELVRALLERGHGVRVVNRSPPAGCGLANLLRAEWRIADLCDEAFDWAFLLAGCSVVYHLAWTSLPASSNTAPARDLSENLLAGLRLLEAARVAGRPRIVFISSGGTVYGRARCLPIGEDHPTRPLCAYGISKLAMENYLTLYRELHGVESVVLRVANAFGPGQDPSRQQGAVAAFLRRAMAGLPLCIWGDGEVVRDYVHVSDVVAALIRAGEAALPANREDPVYNIGSGKGRSLNEVVAAIRKLGLAVEVAHEPARGFDVPANVLDYTRAADQLGWFPRASFADALEHMAREIEATVRSLRVPA
jgi:UDP-glucose 4-epimerase